MIVVSVVCYDIGYVCATIFVGDKNWYIPESKQVTEHELNYINIVYRLMSRWIMDVLGGALRARGRKVTVAVNQLIRVCCFRWSVYADLHV